MSEPVWLAEARKHIGTREVKGAQHEPKILSWWKAIRRGGIKDDETPWCAAFVGAMLESVGIMSSRFESAKSYLDWGQALPAPVVGCIVVVGRDGGGHVAFCVGEDRSGGYLLLLGGNQGDTVCIVAFPRWRVLGYRWPSAVPAPAPLPLPIGEAAASASEA